MAEKMRLKDLDIEFETLIITCDARKNVTHVVVDGKELGDDCTYVRFIHDTKRGINGVKLEKTVLIELIPNDKN